MVAVRRIPEEIELLDEQAKRLAGHTEPLRLPPGWRDTTVRRVALAWLPDTDLT